MPCAAAFDVYPVFQTGNMQERPDVDNGIVVWSEWVEGTQGADWDVYGFDLLDVSGELIYIAAYIDSDQREPAIWNDRVVYQDNYYGDWDVYLSDISDAGNPVSYFMTPDEQNYINNQTNPAIHGNTVVWQDQLAADNWNIVAADITEPNNPSVYIVDDLTYSQAAPAVYRSSVVYQDDTYGDSDIWSADVWLKNAPQYQAVVSDDAGLNQTVPAVWGSIAIYEHETAGGDIDIYGRDMSIPDSEPFIFASSAGLQQAPDISGHLVVWQDNRNGNWDIYGYNLITQQEFQITASLADQTNPAISGSLVVWEDSRAIPTAIYYTWLDGDALANCTGNLPGDVDNNCRVDLADYALMAQNWLACALDPISACTN